MRIHHVKKARKTNIGNCQSCGKPIKKGDAYKLIKPRYGAQKNRHEACPDWRPSEMTSSDKLSTLYAAQEEISDALKSWTDVSELAEALNNAATSAEEARDGYQEAADSDDKQGAIQQQNQEKADAVDEWVSALQDAASEVEGMEAPEECGNCGEVESDHTNHEYEEADECKVCGEPAEHGNHTGSEDPADDAHDFEPTGDCAFKDCGLAEDAHTDHEFESPDDGDWRQEVEQVVEEARDALNMP